MYKRYIKINSEDYIVDLFHERQAEHFDGTEKYLDEVESTADVWINNKGVFDEAGNPLFKYNNGNPIEAPDNIKLLKYLKKKQNEIISDAFEQEFISGKFTSVSIGIEVDCRREGTRNDLQNVTGMITDYDNLTEIEKYYKGTEETTSFPCSLQQLQDLELEMIRFAKTNYFKKREKQALISQSTLETVRTITW